MASGERYRCLAAEFEKRARGEVDSAKATEFRALARSYLRLAEQADANDQLDLVYETPLRGHGGDDSGDSPQET